MLWVIWTRSANSHTGRRLSSCRIKGRTDDSIRPRAATIPTFSLAWKGASTDGNRSFAPDFCGRPACDRTSAGSARPQAVGFFDTASNREEGRVAWIYGGSAGGALFQVT